MAYLTRNVIANHEHVTQKATTRTDECVRDGSLLAKATILRDGGFFVWPSRTGFSGYSYFPLVEGPRFDLSSYLAIDLIKRLLYYYNMDTFAALADPTRRNIFEYIVRGETSVGQIVERFSFKAPTISQHLKVLKEVGLVQSRADKQRRLYTARTDGLAQVESWVQLQQKFMSERLDALENHLRQQ